MTTQLAKRALKTKFGEFTEHMYSNDAIALVMGDVNNCAEVLCRIHSSCLSGHAFGSIECKCREEMEISQQLIQKQGKGIIIWLEQEGRGNGHLAVMQTQELKKNGMSQTEAYESLGYLADARSFEPAADVLIELGAKSVRSLSGSSKKADELKRYGVDVVGLRDLNKWTPKL